MAIHPSAIIDRRAVVESDVEIGPYAIIEGPVILSHGCRIGAHAQIYGATVLGVNNEIGPGAVLGGLPQDLSFDPITESGLILGENNVIREHVTMHRSAQAGGFTRVGSNNLFMVGSHLGHDGVVGDHSVLANQVLIGGHVRVGSHVFIGGGAGIHQFVRIGDFAMIQGHGSISMDVPPFMIASGLNRVAGLNVVGLRRGGLPPEVRQELKEIYRIIYRSSLPLKSSLEEAKRRALSQEAKDLLGFFGERSRKGICLKSSGD